jgi:hypothetical protein
LSIAACHQKSQITGICGFAGTNFGQNSPFDLDRSRVRKNLPPGLGRNIQKGSIGDSINLMQVAIALKFEFIRLNEIT